MTDAGLETILQQLQAPQSPKRRSAAKKLRTLKLPAAGPALLDALKKEVQDPRTWETQYHMIMALAECGHSPALPFIQELSKAPREATLVCTALGDAIVRLGRSHEQDATPLLECIRPDQEAFVRFAQEHEKDANPWNAFKPEQESLMDGAFRAMAMLRLKPDAAAVEEILGFVSRLPVNHRLRFWVSAAAAGWEGESVRTFLKDCVRSPREESRKAAEASLEGKYLEWNPL
jgi:hypothetical protein